MQSIKLQGLSTNRHVQTPTRPRRDHNTIDNNNSNEGTDDDDSDDEELDDSDDEELDDYACARDVLRLARGGHHSEQTRSLLAEVSAYLSEALSPLETCSLSYWQVGIIFFSTSLITDHISA